MKLSRIVINVNADGKEVGRPISRSKRKIREVDDFIAFLIGTEVNVVFVKETVTDNGRLVRVYNMI